VRLIFPNDRSVGTLFARDLQSINPADWKPFEEAKGVITCEPGLAYHLQVSEEAGEDLRFLESLEPSVITSLSLPKLTVNDQTLALLGRFTKLRELFIRSPLAEEQRAAVQRALPACAIQAAQPEILPALEVFKSPEARTLVFPTQRALGRIFTRRWTLALDRPWTLLQTAQGTISIPAGVQVKLEVDYDAADDLTPLGRLSADSLDALGLVGPHVNDAAMDYVARLTGLQELRLLRTAVSDQGLLKLAGLKRLRRLEIQETNIGDEGIAVCRDFPYLQYLWMTHTQVTNKSLPLFLEMKGLRRLHLDHTGVSAEGLTQLRYTLRGCEVTPIEVSQGTASR
jgi:hypothetical protein